MRRASVRAIDRKRPTSRPRAALSSAARARRNDASMRRNWARKSSVRSNAGQLPATTRHAASASPRYNSVWMRASDMAVVLAVKPLVRPALHRLVRLPLALVGLVGGEPHDVHARAQLGFEKSVPAILGGGQQGRQPTRDVANLSLKQQGAEKEDLGRNSSPR